MNQPARRPAQRGSLREALQVDAFRKILVGTALSNTGRWLQTAALGVLGWRISGSSAYLGMLIFAQLMPMGFLALLGGSLADTIDRRKLLLSTQIWQMVWTFVLAAMLIDGEVDQLTLLGIVFIIGIGQGLYAPALTSVLPSIAGEANLSAAIALNSIQINVTRVIGPALGGLLVSEWGYAEVFAINAFSYVFVIGAIARTTIPATTAMARSFRDRVFGGFIVAFRAGQVGRPLAIMFLFALLCLPFIGQLPAIADVNLGIDTESSTYGWFYACFGLGGAAGAALVGTVFLKTPGARVLPAALVGFGLSLGALAVLDQRIPAFIALFLVGLFYLALPTTLATAWQEHVTAEIRGRVGALWVLSFGGTVPFANVIAGQAAELTSLRAVLLFGSVCALLLTTLRLEPGPVVGEEIL